MTYKNPNSFISDLDSDLYKVFGSFPRRITIGENTTNPWAPQNPPTSETISSWYDKLKKQKEDQEKPVTKQVGGTHYASKSIDPIAAMKAWMTPEQLTGFYHGNIIKYVARYRDKNGIEDLEKAKDYIDRLIGHLKEIETK